MSYYLDAEITPARSLSRRGLKVVMLSPLPVDAIRSFCADCREVLVPELNYQGQFAHLMTGATGCAVQRFNQVTGRPMRVDDILAEIRRLAKVIKTHRRVVAA